MCYLDGETVVCGQHTGDEVQLRIFGDEFYARYESTNGYTVVYDTDAGCYCYATLAAGRFVSSGVPIGKAVPAGRRRHLKEDPEVRNEKFGLRYGKLRPPEGLSGSSESRTLGPDGGLLNGRKHSIGQVRGLTILVDFEDVTPSISKADVEEMLNGDNYSANGNFCSVKEYFALVSNNKLLYTSTVVGPVKLSKRRSHYIGTLLVKEALDAAVNDFGIDLSDFDSQNDGVVDAINFLYAGNSQYSGELWPHNSVQALQYGSVRTHYYMLTGLGTARVDLRIGTICHENGHMLCRFPDMYDYGKRDGDHEKSQGIGRYCLMGSGNQLNGRRTPSPVCAYLRELAGWTDDVVILNGPGAHVARHGEYGTVMKWETDSPNEYFLIENRSGMGLDAHLPASGLAIYHCDTLGSNEWQDATRNRHYQCALLQADGAMHLENNINAGDKDDLYAKTQGVAVSHDTTPSSRQWDGTDSGLTISDVGDAGEEIEFKMGEPEVVTVAGGETFPDLLIPDNDPKGVVSTIMVGKAGIATTLEVGVQVIHSWISDLKVILEAPDGTQAILHDNEGNDGDDIDATYRSADHSALATLVGQSIEGEWRLRVIDEAQHDVGRIVRWSLAVAYEPSGKVVDAHAEPMKDIPDMNSAGISSAVEVKPSGTVREIIVTVDIEHTYIGDLQIDLVAPAGASARLHNNEGWYRNDIKRSYDLDSTPALQGMVGQSIAGEWSLAVRDLASADVGVLKSWSLELKY